MNGVVSTLKAFLERNRKFAGFVVFVLILCLMNLVINGINGRFFVSDFKVFYLAAKNLFAGEKVYMTAFGLDSGFYKYSPMTLLLFLPYTFFSFKTAATIHLVILSFCYLYTCLLTRKILTTWFFPDVKHEGWLLFLAVICTLIFLVKELYLGNINILLIFICLMTLNNILMSKQWSGGVLLGIVLLAKPFFLVLILPLLLRRKFKTLAGISFTLFAGFILPFIVLGFQRGLSLHADWIKTILMHGSDYPSMNSIDYLLQYYLFPDLAVYVQNLIIVAAGILAGWFILVNICGERRGKKGKKVEERNFIIEWFLLLAIIPNVMKTDTEHFLASIPVITFIIYFIAVSRRFWLIPVLIILIFFYGGNSQDALGKEFSYRLFSMGLIGISNLLLVLMTLLLFLDFRNRKNRDQFNVNGNNKKKKADRETLS
jgi:hypothetical protein